MRTIFRTVSAAALGLSSLSFGASAHADSLSLRYSDGYCGNPAYSVYYRHGPDYYGPYYRAPRHVHHHHHYGKHPGHDKHGKHHGYRKPGYDRHRHGGHQGHRDDHRGAYSGHQKHRGDQYAGHRDSGHSQRAHTAYASR